jgi:hypothetical protein
MAEGKHEAVYRVIPTRQLCRYLKLAGLTLDI